MHTETAQIQISREKVESTISSQWSGIVKNTIKAETIDGSYVYAYCSEIDGLRLMNHYRFNTDKARLYPNPKLTDKENYKYIFALQTNLPVKH